jgi:hypothetical protein
VAAFYICAANVNCLWQYEKIQTYFRVRFTAGSNLNRGSQKFSSNKIFEDQWQRSPQPKYLKYKITLLTIEL